MDRRGLNRATQTGCAEELPRETAPAHHQVKVDDKIGFDSRRLHPFPPSNHRLTKCLAERRRNLTDPNSGFGSDNAAADAYPLGTHKEGNDGKDRDRTGNPRSDANSDIAGSLGFGGKEHPVLNGVQ